MSDFDNQINQLNNEIINLTNNNNDLTNQLNNSFKAMSCLCRRGFFISNYLLGNFN
jgi:hypothetical protein